MRPFTLLARLPLIMFLFLTSFLSALKIKEIQETDLIQTRTPSKSDGRTDVLVSVFPIFATPKQVNQIHPATGFLPTSVCSCVSPGADSICSEPFFALFIFVVPFTMFIRSATCFSLLKKTSNRLCRRPPPARPPTLRVAVITHGGRKLASMDADGALTKSNIGWLIPGLVGALLRAPRLLYGDKWSPARHRFLCSEFNAVQAFSWCLTAAEVSYSSPLRRIALVKPGARRAPPHVGGSPRDI